MTIVKTPFRRNNSARIKSTKSASKFSRCGPCAYIQQHAPVPLHPPRDIRKAAISVVEASDTHTASAADIARWMAEGRRVLLVVNRASRIARRISMPTSWYLIRSGVRATEGVFTIVIAFHLTWERNYAAQSGNLLRGKLRFADGDFPGEPIGGNCGVSRHVEPSK